MYNTQKFENAHFAWPPKWRCSNSCYGHAHRIRRIYEVRDTCTPSITFDWVSADQSDLDSNLQESMRQSHAIRGPLRVERGCTLRTQPFLWSFCDSSAIWLQLFHFLLLNHSMQPLLDHSTHMLNRLGIYSFYPASCQKCDHTYQLRSTRGILALACCVITWLVYDIFNTIPRVAIEVHNREDNKSDSPHHHN